MTDAERISGLATIAAETLRIAEAQVLRIFALELLVGRTGEKDMEAAIARELANHQNATAILELNKALAALRSQQQALAPERWLLLGKPKPNRTN
jgi:hypothetical protein